MSEKYLGENSTPILINQIKENCTQKRTTLPIASVDELGNTYQYTGTTSGSLVHGYFYECVSDEQDPTIYSWQNVNVQPTAGTPTAATTTFDNTTSELQATNVQDAIDEVDSDVDSVASDVSTLQTDVGNIQDVIPSTATSSNKLIDHDSLGTAAFKDSTDRVSPNNTALVESQSVYSAINTALSSIYKPRGDIACAELTSDLLIAANVGNVYETSDSGTTTALFLQGAGHPIATGDNVGIINAGEGRILFNLMANAFDLTSYQKIDLAQTVEGATTVEGALSALSTNKATQTEVQTLTNNVKTRAELGAYNLLNIFNSEINTSGTYTEVINDDGTVKISGTPTSACTIPYRATTNYNGNVYNLKPNTDYVLDSGLSAISPLQLQVFVKENSSSSWAKIAETTVNTKLAFTTPITFYDLWVRILIPDNVVIPADTIVKPMIILASDITIGFVPYAKTNVELTQDKAEQSEVNDIVNILGAKNILNNEVTTNNDWHGVSRTVNADGTITLNGISTAWDFANFNYVQGQKSIPSGTYIISGGCENTALAIVADGSVIARQYGAGETTFTITDNMVETYARFEMSTNKTFTSESSIIKPMIRVASDLDNTYVPYVPTNAKLNEEKMSYADNGVVGAKNLAKPINSISYLDITVVCDANGVLSITGTASGSGGRLNIVSDSFMLKAGTYKVVHTSSDLTKYSSMVCHRKSDSTSLGYSLINNGTIDNAHAQFTLTSDTECFMGMNTYQGTNYGTDTGTKEYVMVVLADDTDTTYQPYAPINRECVDYKTNGILGAHNLLLKMDLELIKAANSTATWTNNVGVARGITITVNDDGTFTVSGTATGRVAFTIVTSSKVDWLDGLYGKELILSGSIANTQLNIWDNTSSIYYAYTGNGEESDIFHIPENNHTIFTEFVIGNGNTVNGTIKPIVRLASDTDKTFQPYAMTNRELTEQKFSYKDNGVLGAKNLWAHGNQSVYQQKGFYVNIPNGRYIFSADVTSNDTDANTCLVYDLTNGKPLGYIGRGTNQSIIIDINNVSIINLYASTYAVLSTGDTATFNNVMIRRVNDTDPTYQPYAMTNQQLTGDMIYSTSEVDTGKIWIDGKPIYRKVIHHAGVVASGSGTLIGNVTGFADVITFEGTFRNNADGNCFPIGYTYSNFGSTVVQNMPFTMGNNGNIYANPYGFDISNINVVVEYTKTT